jgi:predicted RNase H-like HicB family nuclease
MTTEGKTIHVNITGENWEVEGPAGTIAQAETKEEALEAAHEAAREQGAVAIKVHTSDGMVEQEIAVVPQGKPAT